MSRHGQRVEARQSDRKPTEVDRQVGENLKNLRQSRKMTQASLGYGIGLSFKQIRKYEAGENRISAGTLYDLAKVLEVEVEAFYQGLPKPPGNIILPISNEVEELRGVFDQIEKPHERAAFLRMVKGISESELYS